MSDGRMEVRVTGHSAGDKLYFREETSCGDIEDGVGFENGDEGGWVISFADLERMYEAAKAKRGAAKGDGK